MDLSPAQKCIIKKDGYIYVVAPPGSGKTLTLCEKINYIRKHTKEKIIALTFSNNAAEEIRKRVEVKSGVTIGTIHSFCQDVVLSRGYMIGLPKQLNIIEKDSDKVYVLQQVIKSSISLKEQLMKYQSSDGYKKILKYIKRKKNELVSPNEVLSKEGKFKELYYQVYQEYNDYMLKLGLIDFDDILYYAFKILSIEKVSNIYKRVYNHLLVDEAQDLNYTQYRIIKVLGKLMDNVMLIGDPSQSLYRFMGSSQKFMTVNYPKDFNAKKHFLDENYRSASKIVDMTNLLSSEKPTICISKEEGLVEYRNYTDEDEEAIEIVNKIQEIIKTNDYRHEDIAVIGRNAYLFKSLIHECRSKGIPFNFGVTSNDDFESAEIRVLFKLFKLKVNPNNIIILDSLKTLFELPKEANDDDVYAKVRKRYEVEYDFVDRVYSNLNILKKEIVKLKKYYYELDINEDDKYYITSDLIFLFENWNNYLRRSSVETRNLRGFLNDFAMGKTFSFSNDGISLLTIHKAKGLEFSVVFVIGLNEGVLPDYRAIEAGDVSEEDNNVYVAFSRAKSICYISSVMKKWMPWGAYRTFEESRYIKKIKTIL